MQISFIYLKSVLNWFQFHPRRPALSGIEDKKFMYKGTIVENSLADKNILGEVKITKTWQSSNWTLHDVLVGESQIPKLSNSLSDGPWYIHVWKTDNNKVKVIYKNKVFEIDHSDKSTWTEAVAYGKSIGIPEEQLDFVIE